MSLDPGAPTAPRAGPPEESPPEVLPRAAAPRVVSIQVLRAVAAWMVVGYHYMQLFHGLRGGGAAGWWFSARGTFGVDLFFVISGFAMHRAVTGSSPSGFEFLRRRVARIVPAYWGMTLLLLLLQWLVPRAITGTAWTPLSLAQSLLFIPGPNPAGSGTFPYLPVGWTLIYEMAFYALLAGALLVSRRRATWLCLGALLLLGVSIRFPAGSWRLSEFGAGLLLGALAGPASGRASLRRLLSGLGLGLTGFALATLWFDAWPWRAAGATLVVAGSLCAEPWISPRFPWGLLRRAGDLSYSTYLCHTLVLALAVAFIMPARGPLAQGLLLTGLILAILSVSWLSHQIMERPWLGATRAREGRQAG